MAVDRSDGLVVIAWTRGRFDESIPAEIVLLSERSCRIPGQHGECAHADSLPSDDSRAERDANDIREKQDVTRRWEKQQEGGEPEKPACDPAQRAK